MMVRTEAERLMALSYEGGIVTVSCVLCERFDLLVERNTRGEKVARERISLHLRTSHDCRGVC